ncbi:MAG: hypothetical protein KA536_22100 [Saprospiraceae bacterium]|nr:hypothetical protein [Saprospiraceae bacterium]
MYIRIKFLMCRQGYILLCLIFSIGVLSGQTTQNEIFENIEKTGGVLFAYPESEIGNQSMVPKGYKPFYLSHFGRHGSRYLASDSDYKAVLDEFSNAAHFNKLTPLGADVLSRMNQIWEEAQGRGGDLSPLGLKQMRSIAERMHLSFPEIFEDSLIISARSTLVPRCILSMDAFCEKLKELNPKHQISREASNKYMSYLNFHTKEAVAFRSEINTWRKDLQEFEKKKIAPERLMNSLFNDSTYIIKKLNSISLMKGLYEIAGGMQNMDLKLSLYDIFTREELFNLWQCKNYKLYIEYANAGQNGGIMMPNAKNVLINILDSANEVIEKKKNGATFRFAHDGNIIPLAMLLHLDNCYNVSSNPDEYYKAWSDFKVAPMAGNIQIVFFRNKDSGDIIVKFLLHEKETIIPVIKSELKPPFYRWSEVKQYYESLLEKYNVAVSN